MLLTLVLAVSVQAVEVNDYIIDNNIGDYFKSYPGACPIGSGVISGAGHFKKDHNDYACDIRYYNESLDLGVDVQVTQHAGADSDKWLLHEVESSFRGREKEGWFGQGLRGSASIREISGNKIFDYGNIDYRWTSNNVVVYIHYADLQGNKPEPLEIVQAYLQKLPSTTTITDAEAKSRAHNEQWIKDEMARRLWLADKWFAALEAGTANEKAVNQNVLESMLVFLDYRDKYFGINAKKEKTKLYEYQLNNNGAGIKAKLEEYKQWWKENKSSAIRL